MSEKPAITFHKAIQQNGTHFIKNSQGLLSISVLYAAFHIMYTMQLTNASYNAYMHFYTCTLSSNVVISSDHNQCRHEIEIRTEQFLGLLILISITQLSPQSIYIYIRTSPNAIEALFGESQVVKCLFLFFVLFIIVRRSSYSETQTINLLQSEQSSTF